MSGIFHMMFNKIASAIQAAFAVDLDGTNDYFSRASDLTGNADGKTFTFSAWVWLNNPTTEQHQIYRNGSGRVILSVSTANLTLACYNSAGTQILATTFPASTSTASIGYGWTHILVSIDLASTSNRKCYINDSVVSLSYGTYTNDNIDFTQTNHYIGAADGPTVTFGTGRLAHIFLDYTYRDLSVTANRRYFITADRKPAAGQSGLNPIIYMPMDDPTTAHVNQGTGGDFTLNGTIARSGRGPNQYNVAYSDLDGAADYLSRTSAITGITSSRQFTIHCWFSQDTVMTPGYIFAMSSRVQLYRDGSGDLYFVLIDDNNSTERCRFTLSSGNLSNERNYTVTISIDLSSTSNRHVYINGISRSVTWNNYSNALLDLSTTSPSRIGLKGSAIDGYWNGKLGDVFFHTSYIDLSVPANLAKFVTGTGIDAKPVDLGANGELPFGTAPLIYLPMYGNNAGKNYGSGGDFTVNSGPYTGARGPSEFWGNKADFDGSTGQLARTANMTGAADSKTFSAVFFVNLDTTGGVSHCICSFGTAGTRRFEILINTSGSISIFGNNSSGLGRLNATTSTLLSSSTTYCVQVCMDLANTAKRFVYINNVNDGSVTYSTYTDDLIDFEVSTSPDHRIGVKNSGASFLDGKLSEFYFTTEYIDFSQESNRLKFRDAFGNPVYLGADGSLPTGTAPAIYMRFDPAAQGTNSGTGGAFTKSGTINDGGQL